jgi:hypothetical protein
MNILVGVIEAPDCDAFIFRALKVMSCTVPDDMQADQIVTRMSARVPLRPKYRSDFINIRLRRPNYEIHDT